MSLSRSIKRRKMLREKGRTTCPRCRAELMDKPGYGIVCPECGWRKTTLEIDCRKCINCDLENACCMLYGNDPEKAVKMCASKGFEDYIIKCSEQKEAEKDENAG